MQSGYWNSRAEETTGDEYIYISFKRRFDCNHQRGKLSLCKYVQLIPSISEYDLFQTLCLLKSTHYNPDSYQMETNYRRPCTRDTHTHKEPRILAQCLTTAVGPLVIGRSSRGNVKPFFHPQTELSVRLEEGSAAIWRLKIACPHPGPFTGHTGNTVFREPRGRIHLHSLW